MKAAVQKVYSSIRKIMNELIPLKDEDFEISNDHLILKRIRLFSTIIFTICSLMTVVSLLFIWLKGFTQPWISLLVIHTTLSGINGLMILVNRYLLKGRYNRRVTHQVIHIYMSTSLIVCVIISLVNQYQGGDIFLFFIALLGFAFVCPCRPFTAFCYLACSTCLFLIGLTFIPMHYTMRLSIILNVALTDIFSAIISLSLYRANVADFSNRNKIRERERSFRKLFLFNPQPLMVIRMEDGLVVLANEKACRLYGVTHQQLCNTYVKEIFARQDEWLSLQYKVKQNGSIHNYVTEHLAGGQKKWVMVGLELIEYNGEVAALCEVADVTELKRHEKALTADAYIDPLTGALNRRRGMELLEEALQRTQAEGGCFTLCFLDLNGLKKVNDQHGHLEGDFFIRTVCGVIEEEISKNDLLFRYGGDEFIILFHAIDLEQAQVICSRMKKRLDSFNRQHLCPYTISISTGLCTFKQGDEMNLEQLIELADREMYKDKERARQEMQNNTESKK